MLILGPDAGHLHELWTVSGCEEAAGHREELEGKDDPFCDASQGIWPLNQLVFFIIYSVCLPLAKSQILDFSDFQILRNFQVFRNTGENRRFDRCILDWTNQCKSLLPTGS